jgi:hypothetical protein
LALVKLAGVPARQAGVVRLYGMQDVAAHKMPPQCCNTRGLADPGATDGST